MSTFPRFWSNSCFLLLGLFAFTGASLGLHAQTAAPAKPPSSNTASGFSIETEMLTYRALESNGEAIACDVARPVGEAPPGAPRSRGLTAGSSTAASTAAAVGGVMGAMTPAGAMLATGSGILGLFAKSQAAEPVGGTIE